MLLICAVWRDFQDLTNSKKDKRMAEIKYAWDKQKS